MKISKITTTTAAVGALSLALAACGGSGGTKDDSAAGVNTGKEYIVTEVTDGQTSFQQVLNPNGGATLSYSTEGGMKVIEVEDGDYTYAFKDMNGNGELDVWEDWREDAGARAEDLAPQLTTEQIAGLMLFSSHERAPGDGLTDDQKEYLSKSYLRAVLNAGSSDVKSNVQWVNEMQAYVETLASEETPYIPVNYSSDPRSEPVGEAFSAEGELSTWPSSLGLAATFDADTVEQFGEMASEEYRALGITTALSPQIDLATEPRWPRISGTFGQDADLSSKLAAAYVTGFQSTYEDGENTGWGDDSVNTVIKHWPGDGAGEGGRESHQEGGKYAVFASDNMEESQIPFIAALDSAAVMTSYSIDTDSKGEAAFGALVGSAYDKERIDILREDNNYDGVLITDWGVTAGGPDDPDAFLAMPWGVEDLTVEERHFEILKSGIDMFGGNNNAAPVLAAYDMWQKAYENGDLDIDADTRFQQSAARILKMSFINGAYDNPYLVLEDSQAAVGSAEKVEAGQQAQLNSVVELKNVDGAISCSEENPYADATVYIPQSYNTGHSSQFGEATYTDGATIDLDVAANYFGKVVTDKVEYDDDGKVTSYTAPDLSDVDLVLVGMDSPDNGAVFNSAGYDMETDTYYPLSLQYRKYTADGDNVRKTSIAGDKLEDGTQENRSYFGESSRISNEADLDAFERAVKAVDASGKDIPVITILNATNPIIPAEFEKNSDAILVGFGVTDEALLQVALGMHDAQGRLPIAFPANMDTVEANYEDAADDYEPYTDSEGNSYDFGFGLSCEGVISD